VSPENLASTTAAQIKAFCVTPAQAGIQKNRETWTPVPDYAIPG